ncbi:MAG: domain containing protein [Firmicutes bacterium]|nr:domain containing protein [Bacillota bacterium]
MIRGYLNIVLLFLIILLISGCSEKAPSNAVIKSSPSSIVEDKLILAGSGSNIPITSKLVEGYRIKTGENVEVLESIGTDGAINAIKSGRLELGLASRPLTAEEREFGLKELPYARVAVVFGVHRDVPDTRISTSEIIEILKGLKTTWSNGAKIYVFVREPKDSSNIVLYEQIPGYKKVLFESYADRRWEVLYSDGGMTGTLQNTKNSFGVVNTTDIATVNSIKALDVNGISPTQENVLSGDYNLIKDLTFVYKDQLSIRSENFLNFVFSPEGKQMLTKWGAVPLGRYCYIN